MVAVTADRLPFTEAIDFIAGKARLPTATHTDLKEAAHARSFVVAGAVKDELLADFHQAVTRAVAEGRTKADFLRDFDTIVAKHGWSYKGGRAWRSGVIYATNMRMSFAAGKWAQVRALAERLAKQGRKVYLRYSAILDGATRPLHKDWGTLGGRGIILPWDHPWWDTHFPPNDWGCRCTVEIMTDDDLAALGWAPTPDDQLPKTVMEDRKVNTSQGEEVWPTPNGIGTGFGYNVGKAWLSGAVPQPLRQPLPAAGPLVKPAVEAPLVPHALDPARLLPAGLPDHEYVGRFLAEFGASWERPAPFRDASGGLIAIGHELFLDGAGDLKVTKYGRERTLLLLADALKDPDEIWVDWTAAGLRRRYLRAVKLPRDGDFPGGAGMLTSFEWSANGWWGGVTGFPPERQGNFERQRSGVLLWKRGQK